VIYGGKKTEADNGLGKYRTAPVGLTIAYPRPIEPHPCPPYQPQPTPPIPRPPSTPPVRTGPVYLD
jgi:hypothetical protein